MASTTYKPVKLATLDEKIYDAATLGTRVRKIYWTLQNGYNDTTKLDHYEITVGEYFSGEWHSNMQQDTNVSKSVLYWKYTPTSDSVKKYRVVIKAVAKTYTDSNGKTKSYWSTTSTKVHVFPSSGWLPDYATVTLTTPTTPTVELKDYKLHAYISNYTNSESGTTANGIEFKLYRNYGEVSSAQCVLLSNYAHIWFDIEPGYTYTVAARAYGTYGSKVIYSEWSDQTDESESKPDSISGAVSVTAVTSTSVRLDWTAVSTADSYDVEYATNEGYFDSSGNVSSQSTTVNYAYITGLDLGETWYFRVRAVNESGESSWSSIVSIVLGKPPEAPTTWSSTSTGKIGKAITLYWVHNAADNSSQTYGQIEFTIGGNTYTVTKQNSTDEDEKDKTSTSSLIIDSSGNVIVNSTTLTTGYADGTNILWRVRTMGITGEYGDWSVQRTIKIYAEPTLVLNCSNEHYWYWDPFNFNTMTIYDAPGELGDPLTTLTAYPLFISAKAYPSVQTPISYSLSIISNDNYETVDIDGQTSSVYAGQTVFSQVYDTVEDLFVSLTASDVNLDSGMSYTIYCIVAMDSGLTAEASLTFDVAWEENMYNVDAALSYDTSNYTMLINPYSTDENANYISSVRLSVYRRELDGSLTEIGSDIKNTGLTSVVDPHPNLDYARYRVVAVDNSTGAISWEDLPAFEVAESGIIVQWNDSWRDYDAASHVSW